MKRTLYESVHIGRVILVFLEMKRHYHGYYYYRYHYYILRDIN